MSDKASERGSTTDGPKSAPIRVYLRIDNRLLREAVGRLFRKTRDLVVISASRKTKSTEQGSPEPTSDLVVADRFDPLWVSSVSSTEADGHCCKVLLIGMSDDPGHFLAAVHAGVTGYLMDNASANDILAAARAPFRGEAYCPPQLCLTLFQAIARGRITIPALGRAPMPNLTLRQERLVTLVEKGLTNKEIASQLNVSEYTVRNHIHRIMRRLRAGNRKEAVDAVRVLRATTGHAHWSLGTIRE
jgi:DNA-binding NarL/FixJ family response regulator